MSQKASAKSSSAVLRADVEQQIFMARGQRVMLDSDLAVLYGVTTKRLNEQVKRNANRFPKDFMFQLTLEEGQALRASRSQTATMKRGQNVKYAPYVFTEHGAVMLASVLTTPVAVEASIRVVRAFVRLRTILATHKKLAEQLDALVHPRRRMTPCKASALDLCRYKSMRSMTKTFKLYSPACVNYLKLHPALAGK